MGPLTEDDKIIIMTVVPAICGLIFTICLLNGVFW